MSKFGTKEDLLKAIESHFSSMQSGKLNTEDLELLVEQARELYERTVVLRYKAYEEKVFGDVREVLEQDQEMEEENPLNLENETDTQLETKEEIQAGEAEEMEHKTEPIFDFDLFEEKTVENQEAETSPEIEEEPEQINGVDVDHGAEFLSEENADEAVEEPKIQEEAESVQHQTENDPFKHIFHDSDSLTSRMMLGKLDSLVGSFGFNERFQCVEELFKGSSEDFNEAIGVLDSQESFDDAKKQLMFYLHLNKWNLDSEIAIEFVRKVERRYLTN